MYEYYDNCTAHKIEILSAVIIISMLKNKYCIISKYIREQNDEINNSHYIIQ